MHKLRVLEVDSRYKLGTNIFNEFFHVFFFLSFWIFAASMTRWFVQGEGSEYFWISADFFFKVQKCTSFLSTKDASIAFYPFSNARVSKVNGTVQTYQGKRGNGDTAPLFNVSGIPTFINSRVSLFLGIFTHLYE